MSEADAPPYSEGSRAIVDFLGLAAQALERPHIHRAFANMGFSTLVTAVSVLLARTTLPTLETTAISRSNALPAASANCPSAEKERRNHHQQGCIQIGRGHPAEASPTVNRHGNRFRAVSLPFGIAQYAGTDLTACRLFDQSRGVPAPDR